MILFRNLKPKTKNQEQRTKDKKIMTQKGKEVATASEYAIMTSSPEDVKGVLQDNLGSEETMSVMDLTRVKVPGSGGTTWSIPDIDSPSGEVETKEIKGIIVAVQTTRQFWDKPYDGGSEPPQCFSEDGITGVGNPGGLCVDCPYNEFESDLQGRKGKACSERRLLFITREADFLPIVISAPPTSLKNVRGYLVGLSGKMKRSHSVYTSISLEKDKNDAGMEYSKIVLRKLGDVEKPDVTKAYSEAIKPFIIKAARELTREDNRDAA